MKAAKRSIWSGALGQAVGLLVGDHLQAMLDPAQEPVGVDQLVGDRRLEPAGRDQRAQRLAGRRHAHLGHPAAEDQLLGLDEELDLADAAAADLDVVARHPDRAVAAVGVDLALDRVDVADRGVVEMAAPEERLERAQEAARRPSWSPATTRALISAARSQFWPWRS